LEGLLEIEDSMPSWVGSPAKNRGFDAIAANCNTASDPEEAFTASSKLTVEILVHGT